MTNNIYVSQRTGDQAELIERKANTVVLKMIPSGDLKEIGSATLKRWWKLAPETAKAPATEAEVPAEQAEGPAEIQGAPTEAQDSPEQPETKEADTDKPCEEKAHSGAMNMSEVVGKLENLFDLLNVLYFEDSLDRPVITVQSTPKFFGHCSTKKIWKSETESMYEINIGAEYLNRPKESVAATMCHEMVHLFCLVNDIRDTCQGGRYHNKQFKIECEARDLEVGYDRANGYTHTTPSTAFTQKLAENGFDLTVPFARNTFVAKKSASRTKAHKYVCPECGQTVRSTSELKLNCGICDVALERVD